MNRSLLAAVAGIAVLGTAAGAYVVASPGGGEEEVVQQAATATPRATSASPSAEPTTPPPTTAVTPVSSPSVIPSDWLEYVDPVLGFSLRYPRDLTFKDLTGPSPVVGVNERGFEFRSPTEPLRGFTISVSSNADGVSPESWLRDHAACLPDTIRSGDVGGQPAASCTSKPAQIPEAAVALPHMGKMLFITSSMPISDFEMVLASVRP